MTETSRSVIASDNRKQLVTLCNRFSIDTAIHTRMLPVIPNSMIGSRARTSQWHCSKMIEVSDILLVLSTVRSVVFHIGGVQHAFPIYRNNFIFKDTHHLNLFLPLLEYPNRHITLVFHFLMATADKISILLHCIIYLNKQKLTPSHCLSVE